MQLDENSFYHSYHRNSDKVITLQGWNENFKPNKIPAFPRREHDAEFSKRVQAKI